MTLWQIDHASTVSELAASLDRHNLEIDALYRVRQGGARVWCARVCDRNITPRRFFEALAPDAVDAINIALRAIAAKPRP